MSLLSGSPESTVVATNQSELRAVRALGIPNHGPSNIQNPSNIQYIKNCVSIFTFVVVVFISWWSSMDLYSRRCKGILAGLLTLCWIQFGLIVCGRCFQDKGSAPSAAQPIDRRWIPSIMDASDRLEAIDGV
eukprot:SAG31_NODE_11205_length_1054_cov_1.201047_1_plen_131_part_10